MKFKYLRDYICCGCKVIKGTFKSEYLSTHEPTPFDEDIVIGIRSKDIQLNGFCAGSYIEVLLEE